MLVVFSGQGADSVNVLDKLKALAAALGNQGGNRADAGIAGEGLHAANAALAVGPYHVVLGSAQGAQLDVAIGLVISGVAAIAGDINRTSGVSGSGNLVGGDVDHRALSGRQQRNPQRGESRRPR